MKSLDKPSDKPVHEGYPPAPLPATLPKGSATGARLK